MHSILNQFRRILQIAGAMLPFIAFAASARADIFQWEYINPADPSQGKQQSTTLAPDGAGIDVVPGATLSYRNLTMAYLIKSDLTGADGESANLTNADLSQANLLNGYFAGATLTAANFDQSHLTNSSFYGAMLENADFAGTEVRGADFAISFNGQQAYGTGITLAQLYSTASYQAHDLSGIGLYRNGLAVGNFTGQNLTGANFSEATLTDADFTGAQIRGASFGITFYSPVPGTWEFFAGTGISFAQLYSTASYQTRDLSGINLQLNELAGVNFAGQNLANAYFAYATLTGANFRGAYLANARFAAAYDYCSMLGCGRGSEAELTGADFTAADVRNGSDFQLTEYSLSSATTTNLIWPNGHIKGLDLDAGGLLVVRDYDGNPTPIPITVDRHLTIGPGGTLRMVFETDAWDSTISFAPGIPVTLDGTLELTFALDVSLTSQIGRTFDLFIWTGVNPTGSFAVSSPYTWDLSNLYTTGEVTLTAVPEPAGFALAAVGAFSLTFYCRRKIL